MIEKLKKHIKNTLEENLKGYILIIVTFVFGMILAGIVNPFENDSVEMNLYLDDFVSNVKNYGTDSLETFKNSISGYIKFNGVVFLMSLCICGYIGVLAMIFIKGFSYGIVFSTLFELSYYRGFSFFVCSVLPHALLTFPCCVVYSLFCIKNSIHVSKGTKITLLKPFFSGVISLLVLSAGALVQAYVEPIFIGLINF